MKYRHRRPYLFFSSSTGELSLLSTNQRKCSPNLANISRTCWAFWTPNIASSQFDEYEDRQTDRQLRINYVGLGSTNNPTYVHEANVRPIKHGLKLSYSTPRAEETWKTCSVCVQMTNFASITHWRNYLGSEVDKLMLSDGKASA